MSLVCLWNEVGDILCQVSSSPFCTRPFWRMPSKVSWADPGVLWKNAPRATRAMRGKTLETVPFQPYFGCTESFLKSAVKRVLPSNESYESKTGCNRTLPTVLWVPLISAHALYDTPLQVANNAFWDTSDPPPPPEMICRNLKRQHD